MSEFRADTASGRRPGSSARPGTRGAPGGPAARPPTGIRPMARLGTAMPPGTAARPGTQARGAGAGLLGAQIRVADRPVTREGLSGMKTASKGPQRQIMDKSYFLGQLRSKMNELIAENNKLQKEVDNFNQENSTYLAYEKRAEVLASEIKEKQGELADYNMLVDKLNTNTDIEEVQQEYNMLKAQNDREAQGMDAIFTERRAKESQMKAVEQEIERERQAADVIVQNMAPEQQRSYMEMKEANERLLQELEAKQQELDDLSAKKASLEASMANTPLKLECVALYGKLREVEAKRNQMQAEDQAMLTPEEERERLLKQVKEDNQEIASMDRQLSEVKEKIGHLNEEIGQLENDMEEHQEGERNQKYKELKKREESMDEFLSAFEENRRQEVERKAELEAAIVSLLESISRSMGRSKQISNVSAQELRTMQEDLTFKETEMKKSEVTAHGLSGESQRLQLDLEKVKQLETKIQAELEALKERERSMTEELVVYSDLDALRAAGEDKKKRLQEEKVTLALRRDAFRKRLQALSGELEAARAQLQDNETHAQLTNLERKWQHHEQNNFVMKEFIATKSMESDYQPLMKSVMQQVSRYNRLLQEGLQGGRA
ncbi:intraflagellar transport protein 74 homolog isoform X1 [Petromyzon marinus]|uniref:Intraflagellar transport protein 74 homolog isoform X1 n=2 Tax=Petromyzon marinus TaxID=7757 RepID=A0AAJ7X5V7_PETMA|nr:intraflagellar transport protein 74 homolog isoform X1 [Petromyzon marinus]